MQTYISRSEQRFLEDGIEQNIRIDGRNCLEYRPYSIDTGIIPSANGSARVHTYDADVISAVKCEIGMTTQSTSEEGNICINIEYESSAMNEGSEEDVTLVKRALTDMCISNLLNDNKQLIIKLNHSWWIVYIDVTVLKGTTSVRLIDIISMAIMSSLSDTILPSVRWHELPTEPSDKIIHTSSNNSIPDMDTSLAQTNTQLNLNYLHTDTAINKNVENPQQFFSKTQLVIHTNSQSTFEQAYTNTFPTEVKYTNSQSTSEQAYTNTFPTEVKYTNSQNTYKIEPNFRGRESYFRFGVQNELELQVSDRELAGKVICVDTLPICITVGRIKERYVWDMTYEETLCADVLLIVAINQQCECVGLLKMGKGCINTPSLNAIVHTSQEIAKKLFNHLKNTLETLHTNKLSKLPHTNNHIYF